MKVPVKKKAVLRPKTKPVVEVPVVEDVIDEVASVEEEQKQSDLDGLLATLAATEARLDNLNIEIEARIEEKVKEVTANLGPFLVAAEFRIAEKLIQFFMQSPLWEVEKIVKSTVGATTFYNPYEMFRKLTSQGWKYMGSHFDEHKKETYEMFVRQKGLPKTVRDMLSFYEKFSKEAARPIAPVLAEAKAEDITKRRKMLINHKK